MNKNKYGGLNQNELQELLNEELGVNSVEISKSADKLLLNSLKTHRFFETDSTGNVTFLGYESDIMKFTQNIKISSNLFNLSTNTPKTYISLTNGNLIQYNNWSTSDFIDISNYKKIIVVSDSSQVFLSQYNALYDENKQFIKSVAFNKQKLHNDLLGDVKVSLSILTIDEGQKYLRISETDSNLNHIRIYGIINNDFNGIFNFNIAQRAVTGYHYGNNIFNPNQIVKKCYINKSNGNQIDYASWDSTDFVEVSGYKKIIIVSEKNGTEFSEYNAMYDKDKKFISNLNVSNSAKEYYFDGGCYIILNIPDNVNYIRLSTAQNVLDSVNIYGLIENENKSSSLYIKSNLSMGDNILNNGTNINNTYIATDGKLTNYNGWTSTDFIDISLYKSVIIANHSGKFNAIYNDSKQFVSGITFNNYLDNETIGKVGIEVAYFTTKDSYKYLRLSQTSSLMNNVKIYPVLNDDFNGYLNFEIE